MKVYKVVRDVDGELLSSNSAYCKNERDREKVWGLALVYRVGKVRRPKIKGTKLWAFSTLAAAQDYFYSRCEKLFEAEATGVVPGCILGKPCYLSESDLLSNILERNKQALHPKLQVEGVVLCDSIKLLKEVS